MPMVLPHIKYFVHLIREDNSEKDKIDQKWAKPILVILIGVISVILLSGCSTASASNPINADSSGIFNHYFIYPFSILIKFFANVFHGDYGLSIVLMTFLIRFAIMPLMMNQTKKQLSMKRKDGRPSAGVKRTKGEV